jgi:hypothetical protein
VAGFGICLCFETAASLESLAISSRAARWRSYCIEFFECSGHGGNASLQVTRVRSDESNNRMEYDAWPCSAAQKYYTERLHGRDHRYSACSVRPDDHLWMPAVGRDSLNEATCGVVP